MLECHDAQENCKKLRDLNQPYSETTSEIPSEISINEAPLYDHVSGKQAMNLSMNFRMNNEPINMKIYDNEPLNMSMNKTEPQKNIDNTSNFNIMGNCTNIGNDEIDIENYETENYETENLSSTVPVEYNLHNSKPQCNKTNTPGTLDLNLNDIEPLDMNFEIKKAELFSDKTFGTVYEKVIEIMKVTSLDIDRIFSNIIIASKQILESYRKIIEKKKVFWDKFKEQYLALDLIKSSDGKARRC